MKKLCFLFVFFALTVNALADVPETMNYQGRLTDISGNPVADANYTITIQLYLNIDDEVSNYLWSENHNVDTKNGYFNVALGKISPLNLDFHVQYYLGIKVGGDSEMTPRQPLAGVPYALRAFYGLDLYDSLGGFLPKPIMIMGTNITGATGEVAISFQNVFQDSPSNPVVLVSGTSTSSGELLTIEVVDKNTANVYSWDPENSSQRQGTRGFSWMAIGFEFAN
ncbi:hypothetical protein K8S19_13625 [bacterium]|nr:hypothetical protein [bacterium]